MSFIVLASSFQTISLLLTMIPDIKLKINGKLPLAGDLRSKA